MSQQTHDSSSARRPLSRRQLFSRTALLGSAFLLQGCGILPRGFRQPASAVPSASAPTPTTPPKLSAAPVTPTTTPSNIPAKVPDQPTAPPTATHTPGPAQVTDRLSVIQARALSSTHDDFVHQRIQEFATSRGYPLDLVYADAFAGADDIVQKLTAAVRANSAPDVMVHNVSPVRLRTPGTLADLTDLTRTLIQRHGEVAPSSRRASFLEGRWWSVPYYLEAQGYFVRRSAFAGKNVDVSKNLPTIDTIRDACLAVSDPAKQLWGWGMTANRCEKGEILVSDLILMCGGQLTEETGQLVMLNRGEFRDGAIAGLTWLRDVYADQKWSQLLPPGVRTWTNTSNVDEFLNGRVAFTGDTGALFNRAIADNNPVWEDTYLIAPPKGLDPNPRNKAGADAAYWFVFMGAKNRDAAQQLIEFMLSPENQREIFKRSPGYAYPSYRGVWDDPTIRDSREAQHVTDAFHAAAWDSIGFTGPDWPGPPSIWVRSLTNSSFWTDTFREILDGKAIDQALADAHARAVKVAQDFGARGG